MPLTVPRSGCAKAALLGGLLCASQPGRAAEASRGLPWIGDATVLLRGLALQGEPNTGVYGFDAASSSSDVFLQPSGRSQRVGLLLIAGGEIEVAPWLLVRGSVDSGELTDGASLSPPVDGLASDGRSLSDWAASWSFVREAAAVVGNSDANLAVGRLRTRVADGLVLDDFVPTATGTFSFGGGGAESVWSVRATGALVGAGTSGSNQSSPMLSLALSFEPSFFESVSVFGAWLRDESGVTETALKSAIGERAMADLANSPALLASRLDTLLNDSGEQDTAIGYAGCSWLLSPWVGLRLRGTVVLQSGQMRGALPDGTAYSIGVRGWAAHADALYAVTPRLAFGGFAVGLSGDTPPTLRELSDQGAYRAFVAVAPYWTFTSLFFSGGLSQGLFSGRAAAAGVNGHGVLAGGVRAEFGWDDGLVEVRAAYLRAFAPPLEELGGTGMDYGIETDIFGEWRVLSWLGVGGEVDILWPGTFFPQRTVAVRVIGQANASWQW